MNRSRPWLPVGAIVIVAATAIAYIPSYRAGFIWDDDSYVTNNPVLSSPAALRRIWFEIGATPQYYPLVFTSFWLERQAWGLHPLGFHIVNVLLHIGSSLLLWCILRRLRVPGAWIGAALFALHPVQVESVAWITERKNTLSCLLYFAAALAYLRFAPPAPAEETRPRRWQWYALAFLFFLGALLSKTVTCTLGPALAVLLWWKRPRFRVADALPLVPMLLAGIAFGLLTAWLEHEHVGAKQVNWDLDWLDRMLLAGRIAWSYASKLVWPEPLLFFYPRWQVNHADLWQYVYPAGAIALLGALWLARKWIGKGPLAAVLIFGGTLFPALGFVDVYPFVFSWVADHFQYHASAALLALFAAALARSLGIAEQWRAPAQAPGGSRGGVGLVLRWTPVAAVLATLGVMTYRQGHIYQDEETLYRETLRRNSSAWLPHLNLGTRLAARNELDQAIMHFEQAVRYGPDSALAHYNLARALLQTGRVREAITHSQEAARLQPQSDEVWRQLGDSLARDQRLDDAVEAFRTAIARQPANAHAHSQLGTTLVLRGELDAGITELSEALRLSPDLAVARKHLGQALLTRAERRVSAGAEREALADLKEAARCQPGNPEIPYRMGQLQQRQGDLPAAAASFREALRVQPAHAGARSALEALSATSAPAVGP